MGKYRSELNWGETQVRQQVKQHLKIDTWIECGQAAADWNSQESGPTSMLEGYGKEKWHVGHSPAHQQWSGHSAETALHCWLTAVSLRL